jgi:hypothetical protein
MAMIFDDCGVAKLINHLLIVTCGMMMVARGASAKSCLSRDYRM